MTTTDRPAPPPAPVPAPLLDPNFRLPPQVRPLRYRCELVIDPSAKTFSGRASVQLQLDAAQSQLVLHAVDLEIGEAELRRGDERWRPTSIRPAAASETVVFAFADPVAAGEAELSLAWSGRFTPGLKGLYDAQGIAVTQFQTADARRVLPCFDEPGFKPRWQLTLEVPEEIPTLLANGAATREERRDGRRRITFAETPPLSSYLVALALGDLVGSEPTETRTGVPLRTWTTPQKRHLAPFSLEITRTALERLEDYFDQPYAFGKVDLVGVPDFAAGAMENAGLITFRELALLADPATASLAQLRRVAEVIIHELAHQWFGNRVTMAWWNDLWLNEAFATWMANKVLADWKPDWRVWNEFDKARFSAFELDALRSTHPVRGEVLNAAQADEAFDRITYEKGGAVLRMLEAYLGEAPFRDGLRAYMRTHCDGNATAEDLWRALQDASSVPVGALAAAWIGQPGFPLVSVERDGARVRLSQQRFFAEPDVRGEERWPVPVVLRWQDEQGVREERVLFEQAQAEHALPARGEVRWLCANAGGTGFYRVAYPAQETRALVAHAAQLRPSEKVAMLSDAWALARAGGRSIDHYLELARGFAGESDPSVLQELVARLGVVDEELLDPPPQATLRAYLVERFGPGFAALGWQAPPDESLEQKERRAALLAAAGLVGRGPAVVAEARERVERFLTGESAALPPDLKSVAIAIAAREGDAGLFERLLSRAGDEPDPMLARICLLALAGFEAPALAARAEQLAFSATVKAQDFPFYVAALLRNPSALESTWTMLQSRWSEALARSSGMLRQRLVEAVGRLTERRHLEAAQAHFAAHPDTGVEASVAQTLERMRLEVAFRERARPEARAWVQRELRTLVV